MKNVLVQRANPLSSLFNGECKILENITRICKYAVLRSLVGVPFQPVGEINSE